MEEYVYVSVVGVYLKINKKILNEYFTFYKLFFFAILIPYLSIHLLLFLVSMCTSALPPLTPYIREKKKKET